MRLKLWWGISLCGAASMCVAQSGEGVQQQTTGSSQALFVAVAPPVAGEPYDAQKVTRSVQTLSDGTVITHETRGQVARDGEGRFREYTVMMRSGQVEGREIDTSLRLYQVGDPVARTELTWSGGSSKSALLFHVRSPLAARPASAAATLSAPDSPPPSHPLPRVVSGSGTVGTVERNEVQTEDLGQQSIEGVLATGKRVTTTIPAGKVGNDRPIIVVHEEWRSPELKILVTTVDRDPRTGEQTMELHELVRTEPDAALFKPPAGYEVREMPDPLNGSVVIGAVKTP